MSSTFATDRRGFSLFEMAIVLGVVGIVMGGLWGVVGMVRENMKRDEAVSQMALIVKNVRDFAMNRAALNTAANKTGYKELTSYLLERGVLLPEQIRNRKDGSPGNFLADHPWGSAGDASNGSFGICADNTNCQIAANANASEFEAQFRGLKKSSCIALASKLAGPSGPPGLLRLHINGGSARDMPLNVEDLPGACSSDTSNTLEFVYRLRLQN